MTFGLWLDEHLTSAGATQEELAERAAITQQAVSKWIRGVSLPGRGKAYSAISELTGTDLQAVIDLVEADRKRRRNIELDLDPSLVAEEEELQARLLVVQAKLAEGKSPKRARARRRADK